MTQERQDRASTAGDATVIGGRGGNAETPQGRREFSLTVTGWWALACGGILLSLLAYFVIVVVPPMTRPTAYFDALTEQVSRSAIGKEHETDKLSVDLAVILEYTNADIRALNVQVAFSLVGGFALAVTGILLFAVGAKDAIRFAASHSDWRWQLSTTAPGTLVLVLGAAVMLTGIAKNTIRPMDTWIRRPEGLRLETEAKLVPAPGVEVNGQSEGKSQQQAEGASKESRKQDPPRSGTSAEEPSSVPL